MAENDDLYRRITERKWFHTIDLGGGLVTNGDSPVSEIIAKSIPNVKGKSVLDIGAWDGKYSFEAEAAGASRVVALDHYVWRLDPTARQAYYDQCEADGVLPDPDLIDGGFLVPDGLPGKEGFDMAHEYLGSQVESQVDDFMTMDLPALGQFDVVFYFGVLYHMVDPIGSLKRVHQVTKEMAVIETAAIEVPGYAGSNLVEFFAGDELHADYGNWFAPSATALRDMCRAAGFRKVDLTAQTDVPSQPRFRVRNHAHRPLNCRMVVHAYK
jgi:tRNA (mo5U34)-methyltransferase